MSGDKLLSDELWRSVFPIARFYAKYIAPIVLLIFFCSWGRARLQHGFLPTDLFPILLVALFSFFYWGEFQKLKGRRPAGISGGLGINPGDTILWAKSVILLAAFLHMSLVLGAAVGVY